MLSDELNHASIIDGIRLCKANKYRYKHLDINDLEEKLHDAQVFLILKSGFPAITWDHMCWCSYNLRLIATTTICFNALCISISSTFAWFLFLIISMWCCQ